MLPKTMVQMLTAVPRSCGIFGGVAVVDRALAVPALEHRLDGETDLLDRILREVAAALPPHDRLELGEMRRQSSTASSESLATPARSRAAPSTSSNGSSAIPSTTEPNICTSRR
jgi:hypothetical protein